MKRKFEIRIEREVVDGEYTFSIYAFCDGKKIRQLTNYDSVDNCLIYLPEWYGEICETYHVDDRSDTFEININVVCF